MKMKFTINLLILLLTTTSFSYKFDNLFIKQQNHLKEINFNEKEVINKIKQCENDLEEYVDCLYGANTFAKDNIDELCNNFNSRKCKIFINNPMATIPSCSKIPEELKINYNNLFQISRPSMNFFCQKREDGELCPLVKLELSKNKNYSDKILLSNVERTCNSKKCTDAALDLYTTLYNAIDSEESILNEDKEAMKNNKTIMNILEILKSDKCIKRYKRKFNFEKAKKNVKINL